MTKMKKFRWYQWFSPISILLLAWASHIPRKYAVDPRTVSNVEFFLYTSVLFPLVCFFFAAYLIPTLFALDLKAPTRKLSIGLLGFIVLVIVVVSLYAFVSNFSLIYTYRWLAFCLYTVAGLLFGAVLSKSKT